MSQRINAVKLRFERAKLPTEFKECDLSIHSTINILKSDTKKEEQIGFQTQQFYDPKEIEFGEPSGVLYELSSGGLLKKHTKHEPIWAYDIKDEVTDGDIWVPITKDDKSLRIKVSSFKFHGYVDLIINTETDTNQIWTMDNVNNHDLHDANGQKINGATLKFSYELGTSYHVEFKVGDGHIATGSGGLNFIQDFVSHTKVNPKMKVHFQIHGTANTSRFYTVSNENILKRIISKIFSSNESINTNIYLVKSIGEPVAMSLRITTILEIQANWYLDKAILTIDKTDFHEEFPCYQWITQGRLKTIGIVTGMLPGKVYKKATNPKLELLRRNALEVVRGIYQWERQENLPSHLFGMDYGCKDLIPREEMYSEVKSGEFLSDVFDGVHLTVHNFLKEFLGKDFKKLEDHHLVYHQLGPLGMKGPAETEKNWKDDWYYGWMSVAGVNPYHFELIKKVPSQFADCHLVDISGKPIILEDACSQGRLFYSDYTGLAALELHNKGVLNPPKHQDGTKYSAPCTCLFYVDTDKKLRPIAIQLIPGGLIFTSKDTTWQWLYAKMAVRNADSQYHQIWDHWFNAHAMSEVYAISINRALSRVHPIYRLLINHLKYTININTAARHGLISSGGFALTNTSVGYKYGKLIVPNYAKMDLNKLDFPSRIESLGFGKTKDGVDKGALDEHPFVDDGALVWDAIFDFVGKYLRVYYESDNCIKEDSELRDWIRELFEEGHPVHKNNWPKIETIDALQKLVATIIWTTSCHHSVVNFNQYKVMGFAPNYPLNLFQPIPTIKEVIDEDFIVKSLPKIHSLTSLLFVLHIISQYSKAEEYLLSNPYVELIGDEKAKKIVSDYKASLEKIDKIIDQRNKAREAKGFFAYTLLKPSKIPNSVSI